MAAHKPDTLCQQCGLLFSSPGFRELASTNRFKHSLLQSFRDRTDCRFCHYLWDQDFVGSWTQPVPFRRLKDLLHPPSDKAKSPNVKKFPESWVVITGPKLQGHRSFGRIGYLEPTTIQNHWADTTKVPSAIYVRVESDKGRMLWEFPMLYIVAREDNPCASLTPFRPLEWDGLTQKWAQSLKALIQTCQTSHTHCQPLSATPLPSRLLRIESNYPASPIIKLHVAPKAGQTGQYVALSYCWGGPQPVTLKNDNLDKLQHQGIDTNTLPQTLRDAVSVTHHLGYEYLWVDALCIIQDSAEDKKREIGLMRGIYQNACITIAAATSSAVHEGFLNNKGKISGLYPSCSVPVSLVDEQDESHNEQGELSLVPTHRQSTEAFPINKRGWTYQETLLSPRFLVFGDLEPFLRCQTKEATMTAPTCAAYSAERIHPHRFMNKIKSGPEYNVIIEDGAVIDLRLEFLWKDFLEQYTKRELGLQEDRPHAMAGVIESISNLTGDQCMYGIWKSCSIACLLWKLDLGRESVRIPDLPTWSWMSVTGRVELDSLVHLKGPEASVTWPNDALSKTLQLSCRVLEEDEVLNASHKSQPGILIDWILDLGAVEMAPHRVGRLRPPNPGPIFFLVIGRQTDQTFLALVATSPRSGVYQRVGVAELKNSNTILSKPRQSINLE